MDGEGSAPAALSRQLWPGSTLCCLTRVQDQTALTKTANPALQPQAPPPTPLHFFFFCEWCSVIHLIPSFRCGVSNGVAMLRSSLKTTRAAFQARMGSCRLVLIMQIQLEVASDNNILTKGCFGVVLMAITN